MAHTNLIALPGTQEIVITNNFDAPRELVFKAFTDPELIPQWWGPRGYTTQVKRLEARKGGIWRFIHQGSDGEQYGFNGVYHEVNSPERLVQTFEFEGMPGHVVLESVLFEEKDGKTKVTNQMVFQSVEDRDGMLQSGMQDGESQSAERLAEILAKSLVK